QACVRNESTRPFKVQCRVSRADDLKPQVRWVGLVPMPHFTPHTEPQELDGLSCLPGLVPDPLYPQTEAVIGPRESRSFWISLLVPQDAKPGLREFKVDFVLPEGKRQVDVPVQLQISSLVIQPRHDFHVIHWWRGEATWDYYKTGMFEDNRW